MKHNIHHLAILPRERAKEQGNSIALHQRSDKTGKWLPVTWSQLSDFVDVTACALLSEDVQINENMAVFTQIYEAISLSNIDKYHLKFRLI